MVRARTLLVLIAALVGCSALLGEDEDPGLVQLRESRSLWQDQGIANYEYVVENRCFCALGGHQVRVVVASGAITSLTLVATGQPVEAQYASSYRTVDALFTYLVEAHKKSTAFLEAQYDNVYGYPLHVFIDYKLSTGDDEFGWDIVSFAPGS